MLLMADKEASEDWHVLLKTPSIGTEGHCSYELASGHRMAEVAIGWHDVNGIFSFNLKFLRAEMEMQGIVISYKAQRNRFQTAKMRLMQGSSKAGRQMA